MHAHHRVSFESVCAYIRIYCYSISPRRYIYVYTRTLTTLALFFYTHCIFIRTDRCTSHNPRRDAVRRRRAHGRAAATAPGAETMKKEQQQRCRRSTATSGCLSLSLSLPFLCLSQVLLVRRCCTVGCRDVANIRRTLALGVLPSSCSSSRSIRVCIALGIPPLSPSVRLGS